MREIILKEDELQRLSALVPENGIVLLQGDLGSGKTSLVKSLLKARGFKDEARSPTFSIMQTYSCGKNMIYHYDIYQGGLKSILQNGLIENFFQEALHLVEWGEEDLQDYLLKFNLKSMLIKISTIKDKNKRKYEIYE